MRRHCQGCGQFLPAPFVWRQVGWCSARCLGAYIVRHNLTQLALNLRSKLGRK